MASDARKLVESVLGGHMTSQVWTSTYTPVFPFTPQGFSVGAVLPMVLYLFRWGHRRGRGQFGKTFGPGKPTIASVVTRLIRSDGFAGFESLISEAILGDALLTSSLENKRHAEGHTEQVQRCFPNHYFASWIDLPLDAVNLRNVPEMLVALINGQPKGDTVEPFQEQGRYRVGSRVSDNDLLRVFALGVRTEGDRKSDLKSDRFDETAVIGLDQLIMVRIAQLCGEAPGRAVGKGEPGPIPNQRPLAKCASLNMREDLLVFMDCYGRSQTVARSSFCAMLEASLSVGLTTILLQTLAVLSHWSLTGAIENETLNRITPIFFDCSVGSDVELRAFSERSSTDLRQVITRIPSILMYARLLDFYVRNESDSEKADLPPSAPDATGWMELLGSLLNQTHEESRSGRKILPLKVPTARRSGGE